MGKSKRFPELLLIIMIAATLTAPALAVTGKVYWIASTTDRIQRANVDGTGVEDVLIEPPGYDLQYSDGIAVLPVAGKVYWTSIYQFSGAVYRANLDATFHQFMYGVGDTGVGGIATDLFSDTLYFTDPSDCVPDCGTVRFAPLNGGHSAPIVSDSLPRSIALDPPADKMCWYADFTNKIWCSKLSGSGKKALVQNVEVQGLALDTVGKWLYWVDAGLNAVRRTELDGSPTQTLVSGLVDPTGVALDLQAGKLYWSDAGSGQIGRANLDGSNGEVILTGLAGPRGISLDLGQGAIDLRLEPGVLHWSSPVGAVAFRVVRGDLNALVQSAGNFAVSTEECLGQTTALQVAFSGSPEPGEGFWFLVRAVTASGPGTYDVTHAPQVGFRDAEIKASNNGCQYD